MPLPTSPHPPFAHQCNVPLGPRLTLGTGGHAALLTEVRTVLELRQALGWAQATNLPVLVLGGGSNLLLSDAGFPGLVVVMALRGFEISEDGSVVAAAGEPWDALVAACVSAGLSGVECLSGIPGSTGATPIQNVGAYGQDVSDVISEVRCLDRQSLQEVRFAASECEFGYRTSRFKTQDQGRYLVTEVRLRLSPGPPAAPRYPELRDQLSGQALSLRALRQAVLDTRRKKSMLLSATDPNRRSCGSFFVNPVLSAEAFAEFVKRAAPLAPPSYELPAGARKLPAAWLIEQAGFAKGHRVGRVGLSTKHTLCVVAHDDATSSEVVAFARSLADGVFTRFGVALTPEPVFVGLKW